VIRSFRHKGLAELFQTGRSAKMRADLQRRSLRRLDALDQAIALSDLRVPGFDFHPLRGRPMRYSLHVNGPWCITFE
jgi:proteic killer suppression protein